ncbi:hypothetical protein DFJ68_3357 [Terracoccus luteus]|uniref:Sugar lactone lactonase YvrE n=1 Tax=Terracoccus luteus TaxID=53356 RepID=A0A495Y2E5_9MICO|nr:hypothetical protein [Terracoccus luteus]RKT79879.1 hypothetical protein DFJ68_3357 [Terracoccus luteus]
MDTHFSVGAGSLSSAPVSRRLVLGSAAAAVVTSAVTLSSPGAALASPLTAAGAERRSPRIPLPDGIRPEGITSGPGTRFYVGSLADGRIVTGDVRAGRTTVLLPGATGRNLRGLYWDRRTNLVWAVGNVGEVGHVWAVDGDTGAVAGDTVIDGAVFLNDLVVTRDAVYVTDSNVDRLAVLRLTRGGTPSGAPVRFLRLRGAWPAGGGSEINANGIRELPGGDLVLNNSRVGGLWQVDPSTGRTREIPVAGGPGIVAGDGLEIRGTTLYVVRGSDDASVAVVRLQPTPSGWTARWLRALSSDDLSVPSTATLVGSNLFAVNARFGVPSPDTAPYWVTRLKAV